MTAPAEPAVRPPLPDALVEAVAERFRALSQAPRLRLLEALFDGPRSVGELSERTGLSQANASRHLAVLAAAGFVRRRREGTTVVCALADDVPQKLCGILCGRVLGEIEADLERIRPR